MSLKPIPNSLAYKFFDEARETVCNLAGRWSDEQEYEDIKEYQKVLQSVAPAGLVITSMTKRPFGCTFTAENKTYKMSVTMGGSYSYKRIA